MSVLLIWLCLKNRCGPDSFWEPDRFLRHIHILSYIYNNMQRCVAFYAYYDPTDPFLIPLETDEEVEEHLTTCSLVVSCPRLRRFRLILRLGWCFFGFHMFSPKDSNEWTFQLARNDIEERSPCTCLLDIISS